MRCCICLVISGTDVRRLKLKSMHLYVSKALNKDAGDRLPRQSREGLGRASTNVQRHYSDRLCVLVALEEHMRVCVLSADKTSLTRTPLSSSIFPAKKGLDGNL